MENRLCFQNTRVASNFLIKK